MMAKDPTVKLRDQKISFVPSESSGASSTPIQLPPQEPATVEEQHEEVTQIQQVLPVREKEPETPLEKEAETPLDALRSIIDSTNLQVDDEEPSFVIDTIGDLTLAPAQNHEKLPARQPSPARSDTSSDESVVFQGRAQARIIEDPPVQPPKVSDPNKAVGWASRPSAQEQAFKSAQGQEWRPASPKGSKPRSWNKKSRPDLSPSKEELQALDKLPERKSAIRFAEPEAEKDAEETIASLQAELKQSLPEKSMSKKAALRETIMSENAAPPLDEDVWESEEDYTSFSSNKKANNRRGKRGRKKDNRALKRTQLSDGDDNDSEAAYDDYMANLAAQMEAEGGDGLEFLAAAMTPSAFASSRFADGGPSMVVDGKEIGEDEVLERGKFYTLSESESSSDDVIGQDLDQISDESEYDEEDFNSSDLEEDLEYTEEQQWEDEEDLRRKRIDQMTDEKLAQLWQKQIEIGIDADELVIDDGAEMDTDYGVGDIAAARAGMVDLDLTPFRTPKRSKRSKAGFFPDATALADTVDQYGDAGFDIMDFDRPSLRPRKKGRKGALPAEFEALSDEDLKEELRDQWDNDRERKRVKKAEREDLRAQGLLGSAGKKGKADFNQKYPLGISGAQVHDELRIFLQSEQNTRPFPPMDKKDRKALHEIASVLNLKSKSIGAGKNRFPVLMKTSRTLAYDEVRFDRALTKPFFKNMSNRGKANKFSSQASARKARGGGGDAGVGLRNGELVGAGAKEIGKENFGHRLMEKMGWSKGQALGKDGEGMLTPVEQRMRTGRGGLG